MSKELEQLANLVEIATHDATLNERCDYLDTLTEHAVALKDIFDRMEALEKVYSDATRLTLRGARPPAEPAYAEIVDGVNGHEWNWLLESLAEVPASHQPKGTT